MKKNFIKYSLLLALLFCGNMAMAQRGFVGAGFSYTSIGRSNDAYIDGNTLSGTSRYSIIGLGLSYSRYTSVRRGYTISVNPLTSMKMTFTPDGANAKVIERKYSGLSFGVGMFGLIATDYQSKVEIHICNYFQFSALGDQSFTALDLIGLAGRYRINSKMKAALEIYPVGIYNGNIRSLGKTVGLKFYYAP